MGKHAHKIHSKGDLKSVGGGRHRHRRHKRRKRGGGGGGGFGKDYHSHVKKRTEQCNATTKLFQNLSRNETQLKRKSDSVKFFIEFFKQTTFISYVSATSFERNEDMHMIDHIIRTVVPWYRLFATKQYAPRQASSDEYATIFMENIVKLLYNQGMYVCKMISMANVTCTVDKLELTPLESALFTSISTHLARCGSSLQKLPREIVTVKNKIHSILKACTSTEMDDENTKTKLDLFARDYNHTSPFASDLFELVFVNSESLWQILNENENMERECEEQQNSTQQKNNKKKKKKKKKKQQPQTTKRPVVVRPADPYLADSTESVEVVHEYGQRLLQNRQRSGSGLPHDSQMAQETLGSLGVTSLEQQQFADTKEYETQLADFRNNFQNQTMVTEIFPRKAFSKIIRQLNRRLKGNMVELFRGLMLDVKAKAVVDLIEQYTSYSRDKPFRYVVTIEQTGDSFLKNTQTKIQESLAPSEKLAFLSHADMSPSAHKVNVMFNLMFRYATFCTAHVVNRFSDVKLCFLLVPKIPHSDTSQMINTSFIDSVQEKVGRANSAEITNRAFQMENVFPDEEGVHLIKANTKTAKVDKAMDAFKNQQHCRLAIISQRGNTGFDFHDTRRNKVTGQRIHIIPQMPYRATNMVQQVGRTNRNDQISSPSYILLRLNIGGEIRFAEVLQKRLNDLRAGTFGDRHGDGMFNIQSDSVSIFLERQLFINVINLVILMLGGYFTNYEILSRIVAGGEPFFNLNSDRFSMIEGIESNISFLGLLCRELKAHAYAIHFRGGAERKGIQERQSLWTTNNTTNTKSKTTTVGIRLRNLLSGDPPTTTRPEEEEEEEETDSRSLFVPNSALRYIAEGYGKCFGVTHLKLFLASPLSKLIESQPTQNFSEEDLKLLREVCHWINILREDYSIKADTETETEPDEASTTDWGQVEMVDIVPNRKGGGRKRKRQQQSSNPNSKKILKIINNLWDVEEEKEEGDGGGKRRRRKKPKLSQELVDEDSSSSSSLSSTTDSSSEVEQEDDEDVDDSEEGRLNRQLDKILGQKKPGAHIKPKQVLEEEDEEVAAVDMEVDREERGDEEECGDEDERTTNTSSNNNNNKAVSGDERLDKMSSEACGNESVVMVSAVNLLDFIRKNYPYVVLKLDPIVAAYNTSFKEKTSSLFNLARSLYLRKDPITYTQFLNAIFPLNFEDQKAIEILLNSTKAWVRANRNIRQLCSIRQKNSITAYYLDSIQNGKKIEDYFGNENRSLTSLFWTAISTHSLPGRQNISSPTFDYSVRVLVEKRNSSLDDAKPQIQDEDKPSHSKQRNRRQSSPVNGGDTIGWERVTLTPANSFFISSFVEEFVYGLVSVAGNFDCIQFENAFDMGLPKTAYYCNM